MDESPQNKATKYGRKKRSKNMGPTYTDASDERRPLNEEFLGLLAVATSTGKIVVYRFLFFYFENSIF